jgi:hypothetical protein
MATKKTKTEPTATDIDAELDALNEQRAALLAKQQAAEAAKAAAERAEREQRILAREAFALQSTNRLRELGRARDAARRAFDAAVAEGGDVIGAWVGYLKAAKAAQAFRTDIERSKTAAHNLRVEPIEQLITQANALEAVSTGNTAAARQARQQWSELVRRLSDGHGLDLADADGAPAYIPLTPELRKRELAAHVAVGNDPERFLPALQSALDKAAASFGSPFDAEFSAFLAEQG